MKKQVKVYLRYEIYVHNLRVHLMYTYRKIYCFINDNDLK